MKNNNFILILLAVSAVVLYLFTRNGSSGFIAPTSGNLPITGYTGQHVLGIPLSSLPPTGIASPGATDTGGSFTQGPSLPPGYDPYNPATYPSQNLIGDSLPFSDTVDLASIYAV